MPTTPDLLAPLLATWDRVLRAHHRSSRSFHGGHSPAPVTPPATLLRDPAPETTVTELEHRLGVPQPPSYRAFHLLSDGAGAQPGLGVQDGAGLHDTENVHWLRDSDPAFVQTVGFGTGTYDPFDAGPVPERHYLDTRRTPTVLKPGHLLYALDISRDHGGGHVVLDPLTLDPDGEWEAWDLATATPTRHRSFAALLEHDLTHLDNPDPTATDEPDTDAIPRALATARDGTADLPTRLRAVRTVIRLAGATHLQDLLLDWAHSTDTTVRRTAVSYLDPADPHALTRLVAASADPEPSVRAAALPRLAAGTEPAARQAAVALLISPDLDGWAVGRIDHDGTDALLDAWSLSRHPRLLQHLADLGDPRAVPGLVETLTDPHTAAEHTNRLVLSAAGPHDPAVVPALMAAAELRTTHLADVARTLARLDATDEQAQVLTRLIRRATAATLNPDPHESLTGLDDAVRQAALLGRPTTTAALIALCDRAPTPPLVRALGWITNPSTTTVTDTVAVLLQAATHPATLTAALEALETVPGPASADVLAALAASGTAAELPALRALARRRDPRARTPLLGLLRSPEPALATQAAHGLRDLRDPGTGHTLLQVMTPTADPDLLAATAHALITLRGPRAIEARARLARSDHPDLRRLADLWAPTPPPGQPAKPSP